MEKNKFFKKVLKNGMTVIFEQRKSSGVVSVAFAVRHGGVHESENEKGISHYIEHMLYKGTKNRTSKQISEDIEKNGGILNGFTEENLTAYWCKMPSDKLNVALNVLSDMIKNPLFEQKEIEKERKVIFEEMKIYHDNPQAYVFEKIQSFLYEYPLGVPLIGTHESMNSIDREKMLKKFKEVYNPNNFVLCVVGDADFKKLVNFAEKHFGNEKGKLPLQKIKPKNEQKTETRRGIDQANIILAYHSPLSTDKTAYAATVLMTMMAHGLSSRLFQEIREKRNLAYSIMGDIHESKNFAYSYVHVGTMKENVEKVKNLILEEFEKVSRELTEKELDAAKEQVLGNYKIAMESSTAQMNQLLLFEMDGHAGDFYKFAKRIKDVKLSDVKKLAKIKDYSFFALMPE